MTKTQAATDGISQANRLKMGLLMISSSMSYNLAAVTPGTTFRAF